MGPEDLEIWLLWDISPDDERELVDWAVELEIELGHDIVYPHKLEL